ncbi:hypothetical protein [Mycobacterium conspicuum]|uniref:hypothetical protein n=1 Tax=Mycobacterium conspicuum TaxID=44010 RepID=UPI00111C0B96|nr:hypothetical protein [Mycobacterium conspicuum]
MQVIVTAIVALIVGLISFLGGVKTNQISTKNNQDTINAQKAENLKQFRREPPQYDRYAAVLKQAAALRNLGGFSLAAISDPNDPNYLNYTQVVRPGPILSQEAFGNPSVSVGAPQSTPPPAAPSTPAPTPTPSPPGPGPTTLENVRGRWQDAYGALAQAVSEAEIAASDRAIDCARALRDKYRYDYRQSVLSQIADVRARLHNKYDMTDDMLADALVAVPGNPSPPPNQAELMKKSVNDLTTEYRDAVRNDLGL